MQNDFRQCQQINDGHNCECLMAIEEAQGCPEVKQMLLEAAVMDLEDALESAVVDIENSLAGIGRAESEARVCI